ncbi:MAG: hypothetical protein M0Z77_06730 [Thermoplasmatales archaeon]|nr:hypothetical protein [Thermoplasmatales archaeon]
MSDEKKLRDAEEVAVRYFLAAIGGGQKNNEKLREQILDTVLTQRLGDFLLFPDVDRDTLRARIEKRFNIEIEAPKILEDTGEHIAWLKERKATGTIEWKLWNRYYRYLIDVKQRPPSVVNDVDRATDEILGRLENPIDLERSWDRRGMVVGQVQSGKTGNYTGLICKALDSGYKVIIVLAGPYNNLRSQVQIRLDEELLGFDTSQFTVGRAPDGIVGVGKLKPEFTPNITPLTNQLEEGDFRLMVAQRVAINPGGNPVLLVVKKNAVVLETVRRFFASGPSAHFDSNLQRNIVTGVPLLVIDDEADYGSVNTADVPTDDEGNFLTDYDPTRINGLVREILMTFGQRAYVGYTATPFANIFIHSEMFQDRYGPDLFPESFIIGLQPPSDYIGPSKIFGNRDSDDGILPLLRAVHDQEDFIPDKHKKDFSPTGLNESVKKAMCSFILACAVRRVRGYKSVHNSMLIHVTRYVLTQAKVADLVKAELEFIKSALAHGEGAYHPSIREILKNLWEEDFVGTSSEVYPEMDPIPWEALNSELLPAVTKMQVIVINGTAADVLSYKENEAQGLNVIAIGGDKLSRGMTLEGLSVSYFLRASRMYDTLLQMGRWFGYRPDYADVCRIFTTDQMVDYYQRIQAADEELRQEFDIMVERKETPRTYGLKVRSHKGLLVTSSVKMRHGIYLNLKYEGDIAETTVFNPDDDTVSHNLNVTDLFLKGLQSTPKVTEGHVLWSGVRADQISTFLRQFKTHKDALEVNGPLIADYIDAQEDVNGVRQWTVVLLNRQNSYHMDDPEEKDEPDVSCALGGHVVVTTKRSPKRYASGEKVTVQRLVSPRHEHIDITEEEWATFENDLKIKGLQVPTKSVREGSGAYARYARPPARGLMLIYPLNPNVFENRIHAPTSKLISPDPDFHISKPIIGLALSFPKDLNAVPIQYAVNNVWWQQEQGTV